MISMRIAGDAAGRVLQTEGRGSVNTGGPNVGDLIIIAQSDAPYPQWLRVASFDLWTQEIGAGREALDALIAQLAPLQPDDTKIWRNLSAGDLPTEASTHGNIYFRDVQDKALGYALTFESLRVMGDKTLPVGTRIETRTQGPRTIVGVAHVFKVIARRALHLYTIVTTQRILPADDGEGQGEGQGEAGANAAPAQKPVAGEKPPATGKAKRADAQGANHRADK